MGFEEASALVGRDDVQAAALFEAFAAQHPDDELAPDALLEAAALHEERLGHPDLAAEMYGRLVERYPSSRLALRARTRREALAAQLPAGPAPLAEFQAIRADAARAPDEAFARMERLVAAHPGAPFADEGRLWLARAAARSGRVTEAMRRFEEVERAATADAVLREARKGRADGALAWGDLLLARRLYASLLDGGDRGTVEAARSGIVAVDRALRRRGWLAVGAAYLLAFLGVCAARGRRHLAPSVELVWYAPVALLFVAASLRGGRVVTLAVAALGAGGALVVWLHGAATKARLVRGPLAGIERFVGAALLLFALAALIWSVLHACNLLDVVVETLRSGPDRD